MIGGDPGRVPSDLTAGQLAVGRAPALDVPAHRRAFCRPHDLARRGPVAQLPSATDPGIATSPFHDPSNGRRTTGRRRDGGHGHRRLDRRPATARWWPRQYHGGMPPRHVAPADVGQQVARRHGGRRACRGRQRSTSTRQSPATFRRLPSRVMRARRCATCWTCGRASSSPRTTWTRSPRSGCSSRPSAGRPEPCPTSRPTCTTSCSRLRQEGGARRPVRVPLV